MRVLFEALPRWKVLEYARIFLGCSGREGDGGNRTPTQVRAGL